ncbi:MAG: hypothetical protein JSR33_03025 [Proteobacteria bacterium]|nr:hypothetical protein [Pseudomonadota bacterium]
MPMICIHIKDAKITIGNLLTSEREQLQSDEIKACKYRRIILRLNDNFDIAFFDSISKELLADAVIQSIDECLFVPANQIVKVTFPKSALSTSKGYIPDISTTTTISTSTSKMFFRIRQETTTDQGSSVIDLKEEIKGQTLVATYSRVIDKAQLLDETRKLIQLDQVDPLDKIKLDLKLSEIKINDPVKCYGELTKDSSREAKDKWYIHQIFGGLEFNVERSVHSGNYVAVFNKDLYVKGSCLLLNKLGLELNTHFLVNLISKQITFTTISKHLQRIAIASLIYRLIGIVIRYQDISFPENIYQIQSKYPESFEPILTVLFKSTPHEVHFKEMKSTAYGLEFKADSLLKSLYAKYIDHLKELRDLVAQSAESKTNTFISSLWQSAKTEAPINKARTGLCWRLLGLASNNSLKPHLNLLVSIPKLSALFKAFEPFLSEIALQCPGSSGSLSSSSSSSSGSSSAPVPGGDYNG